MSNNNLNTLQIKKWASIVFKKEDLDKVVDVKINGSSEKGDGYIGDIAYVKISGTKNGTTKEHDIVIKLAKIGDIRDLLPIQVAFETETYFYENIVPVFTRFLKERKSEKLEINIYPKCFGTHTDIDREILFLENVKSNGYELHDRQAAMDLEHIKLTLSNYGKHHAFSFAMQDQQPEKFRELCQKMKYQRPWLVFSESPLMKESICDSEHCVVEALEEADEPELIKLYRKFYLPEEGFYHSWMNYFSRQYDVNVLTHGDCWNNNFLFKYKDGRPDKCCMLDFQFVSVMSPVFDICYHLYTVTPMDILNEENEFLNLLKAYHDSLKESVRSLGSDLDELFPYTKFIEHWKMFANFALIIASIIILTTTKEKEDINTLEDYSEGKSIKLKLKGSHRKMVYDRLRATARNALIFTQKM